MRAVLLCSLVAFAVVLAVAGDAGAASRCDRYEGRTLARSDSGRLWVSGSQRFACRHRSGVRALIGAHGPHDYLFRITGTYVAWAHRAYVEDGRQYGAGVGAARFCGTRSALSSASGSGGVPSDLELDTGGVLVWVVRQADGTHIVEAMDRRQGGLVSMQSDREQLDEGVAPRSLRRRGHVFSWKGGRVNRWTAPRWGSGC